MSDSGLHLYLYNSHDTQGNIIILCLFPWGHLDKHLTVYLTFKDHWSRDLHDLAERLLNIITIDKVQEEFWVIERQLV